MSRYIDLGSRFSFVVRLTNPVLPAGRRSLLSLDRRLDELRSSSGSGGNTKVQVSARNQSPVVQVTTRYFSDQATSSKKL
jgi:hypothetical protein